MSEGATDDLHPGLLKALEARAREVLPAEVWRHLQQGSGDGLTLQANRQAFDAVPLMPRPLLDARHATLRTELFGRELAHPFLLAPMAYQRLFHPDGEEGTALASQAQDALMVVSSLSSQLLAQVARTGVAWWFQLYWQGSREATLALLHRAEAAGAQAVVFTVDAPVKAATLVLPPGVSAVNLLGLPGVPPPHGESVFSGWMSVAPTWDDLAWLRRQTALPLCVKGLLHPDDAALAVARGADAVVVSNHGGRVIDGAPASMVALPAIVERLGPAVPVLLDSGIRSGRDAFKALSMGARAVLVGRPAMWGLACEGALGVAKVLRVLRDELELAVALCGSPPQGLSHTREMGS